MSYIRKDFIKCDRCGEAREVRHEDVPESMAMRWRSDRSAEGEGWAEVGPGRHLCPRCAAPYLAKKREMEAELRRLSGASSLTVEL